MILSMPMAMSICSNGGSTVGGWCAVTLAALFVRWFLDPWLGDGVPYITLYGAVAGAGVAWFLSRVGPRLLGVDLAMLSEDAGHA